MKRKGSCSIFEILLENMGIEELIKRTFSDKETIDSYNEKDLYELLLNKNISISAINQIMKLHKIGYPLKVSEAANLSTSELRNLVNTCNLENY